MATTMTSNQCRVVLLQALRQYSYPENYLNELLQFLGISQIGPENNLTSEQDSTLRTILNDLGVDTPVEYIVGKANFYRRSFIVSRNTLIPRSDTEPLVEHSLEMLKNMPDTTIIDCGTGSGALIVTLALELQHSNAYKFIATDISKDTLAVAKENAERLHCKDIEFHVADVIPKTGSKFFLPITSNVFIITNPPYIPDSEMLSLPKSVKEYEPDIALRRNISFIDILQQYAEFLTSNGKQISFAIEYSKDGVMEHYYSTFPQDDLRALLSL